MHAKIFLLIFFVGSTIVDGLKCQKCSSTDDDSDCRKGTVSSMESCPADETQCVTSVITRDTDMDEAYYYRACGKKTFCEQNSQAYGRNLFYCNICSKPECNKKYIFKNFNLTCISCSGQGNNSECALGTAKTIKCPPARNYCYQMTLIDGNSPEYERGCGRKEFCDVQNEIRGSQVATCKVCGGSDCNKQSLVGKSCFKCEGTDENSECQTGVVNTTENCFGIECYANLVQGISTFGLPRYERGCATSDYCSKLSKEGDSVKICSTCEDKDNCNSQPINSSAAELSCKKCNDASKSCILGQVKTSVKCSPKQNACYIEYLENNKYSFAKRGCGTLEYCEKERTMYGNQLKRCKVCDSSNCNVEKIVPLSCYDCYSADPSRCDAGNSMRKKVCSTISEVCFHSRTIGTINTHTRGCAQRGYCETIDQSCQEYDGDLKNLKTNI